MRYSILAWLGVVLILLGTILHDPLHRMVVITVGVAILGIRTVMRLRVIANYMGSPIDRQKPGSGRPH